MSVRKTTPLISVLMPVYNGMSTLDRAVRSVRNQTFSGWELLAVDDGSTDGTYEALKAWSARDRRIRALRTSENSGPGAARNLGLRSARGTFVTYLDRDDEYYANYLEQVARLGGRADVLVFRYDFVEGEDSPNSRTRTWDPGRVREKFFLLNIVTPLGIAHRRDLVKDVGGFNEMVWRPGDWDLWKRLARARAEFVFVGLKSGRYHIRSDSHSRAPRITPWQRETAEKNWKAGKPIFGDCPRTPRRNPVRKVAFASPHCLIDFTSGAAIATVQVLQLLDKVGFACQAFCGSRLDAPEEALFEELLANQGSRYEARRARIGTYDGRMIFTSQGKVLVTMFQAASTRGRWSSRAEAEAFLTAYTMFLDKNRPDVLITYGGDPVCRGVVEMAKSRDIPIVFYLHNFLYEDPRAFTAVDYVVVPSEFSRQYHWDKLGLACHVLPNVIDWDRVEVARPKPKYLTFVNPHQVKGVYVFARIAEQLARCRPDIPLLVVEGRSRARSLAQTGIDLSWAENLHTMENAPDPRSFYEVTKLLLVPSLWNESFGLVAAEAMVNGIPVLASNRGALPEIIEGAGFLFEIPDRYTPRTRTIPSAEEVEPWVKTIMRLWDDPDSYQRASQAARRHAQRWHPNRVATSYKTFFANVFPQPGPPLVPKRESCMGSFVAAK